MADFRYFTDRTKEYTKQELEQAKLLDDILTFREISKDSGTFMFVGFKGNLEKKIPSTYLVEAGTIFEHKLLHIFGRTSGPSASVWSNIWDEDGLIPFTGANLTSPTIVSTEVADTQDVLIKGIKELDGDWILVEYTVTLTGTTPVVIPGDIMNVHSMENISSINLTGEVSLQDGTTVYAKISDGGNLYNQTQMAFFVIPTGYVGTVIKISVSVAGGKQSEISYRIKSFGQVAKVKKVFDLTGSFMEQDICFSFDEKTVLDVICKPSAVSTNVSVCFDIVLIKKDVFENIYGSFKQYT